jgi:RNA 2',3'-cyclic 3'-phosphodiesterase
MRAAERRYRRVRVTTEQHWRVFCAIELPQHVCDLVLRHIAKLKESTTQARASWARAAGLHLTIKFLGEIPQGAVGDLSAAADRAAASVAPFALRLERSGVFPERGPAKVLWIGVNDLTKGLTRLQATLEEECALSGFDRETRPFRPHLTVARLRNPKDARVLAAAHRSLKFEPVEFEIRELLVIRSELSSEGSKYSVISRHAFGVR